MFNDFFFLYTFLRKLVFFLYSRLSSPFTAMFLYIFFCFFTFIGLMFIFFFFLGGGGGLWGERGLAWRVGRQYEIQTHMEMKISK
ncbi:hypothetical protein DFH27DRAFT_329212 [Peziza echinospora]|nr:hypothetical protein DFH27DRAFT_329212 [Peziza echinospora]